MRLTSATVIAALLLGAGAALGQEVPVNEAQPKPPQFSQTNLAASRAQYKALQGRLNQVARARNNLRLEARQIADELMDLQARYRTSAPKPTLSPTALFRNDNPDIPRSMIRGPRDVSEELGLEARIISPRIRTPVPTFRGMPLIAYRDDLDDLALEARVMAPMTPDRNLYGFGRGRMIVHRENEADELNARFRQPDSPSLAYQRGWIKHSLGARDQEDVELNERFLGSLISPGIISHGPPPPGYTYTSSLNRARRS